MHNVMISPLCTVALNTFIMWGRNLFTSGGTKVAHCMLYCFCFELRRSMLYLLFLYKVVLMFWLTKAHLTPTIIWHTLVRISLIFIDKCQFVHRLFAIFVKWLLFLGICQTTTKKKKWTCHSLLMFFLILLGFWAGPLEINLGWVWLLNVLNC